MISFETCARTVNAISLLIALFVLGCQPELPPPVEGPPSVPFMLSLDGAQLRADQVIQKMLSDPSGALALRRELMRITLMDRSRRLGNSSSPDIEEWSARLPVDDRADAELFAWASQIIKLKSVDEESLRDRYKEQYPQQQRLVGRQVVLTPPDTWTEDYYQRHLGLFRSQARLTLVQLRHSVIEGASFEELAREVSHHDSSRIRGGQVTLAQLVSEGFSPSFLRVAGSLRPGELSPVLQDDRGAYLLTNKANEPPFAIEAEGVFIPSSYLTEEGLKRAELWSLLESLCDQSNACQLEEMISNQPQLLAVWRERTRTQDTQAKRKKSMRKKRRLSDRAKGDTRSLSGRVASWSSLPSSLLDPVQAVYQSTLSEQMIQSLKEAGATTLLTGAPLYRALPLMFVKEGAWFIRLKGRTIMPALAIPQLRLISVDLTRKGIKEKWGTWGVAQLGEQLKAATEAGRLNEALSALRLQSDPIDVRRLPQELVDQALHVSLKTGGAVLTSSPTSQEGDLNEDTWYLIDLKRRETVQFEEVRASLFEELEREMDDLDALRRALKETWEQLETQIMLHDVEIDLSAADSLGFTREVDVHPH